MKVTYQRIDYNVRLSTKSKVIGYQFILLLFRVYHFFKRIIFSIFNISNFVLFSFAIIYFVLVLIGNWEEGETIKDAILDTWKRDTDLLFFTLIVPVMTNCVVQENQRRKQIKKRYWSWYMISVQINYLIGRIFDDNEEYLALSSCRSDKERKIVISKKSYKRSEIKRQMREIKVKLDIIMRNSWDYALDDFYIKELQMYCIKILNDIDEMEDYVDSNKEEHVKEILADIISELRRIDFLLGKLWTRDTRYNKKIIRLICSDDIRIKGTKNYQRYIG